MQKVRIDKWLWSVRIFKSRTLSSDTCRKGKVKINDLKVKPSYQITIGEKVQVQKNGFDLIFEVVQLLEKRVSATLAQAAYINLTSQEEMRKFEDWFIGKASPERRPRGEGRPTKRDRRELDEFKGDFFDA